MDQKIVTFIQDLEFADINKAQIVKNLYELFTSSSINLQERFIYGGIGFYLNNLLIGGIYVSKKHVSLVFSKGNLLTDKHNVLLGEGKYRRHITLTNLSDVESKNCVFYIKQVISLEVS